MYCQCSHLVSTLPLSLQSSEASPSIAATPDAQKAVQKEWDRLRDITTWDETKVREWQEVARECWRDGSKAHVGRVFNICVEKNSELDPKFRKYKGRTVFQGNQVKDENAEVAMFQELDYWSPAYFVGQMCTEAGRKDLEQQKTIMEDVVKTACSNLNEDEEAMTCNGNIKANICSNLLEDEEQ